MKFDVGSKRVGRIIAAVTTVALGVVLCTGVGTALAASEVEPNDDFDVATPMTMGETMYGTFATYNEKDVYCVAVPEKGSITVTFANDRYFSGMFGCDIILKVYDLNYEQIDKITVSTKTTTPKTTVVTLPKGSCYIRIVHDDWTSGMPADHPYHFKLSYNITPTTITKLSPGSKSFTAKWGKVTATGYQVKYSASKSLSGAKTITVAKNSSSTAIKSLSAKKKYYVKVRAYRVIDGKTYYSAWSAKKTVTTK